MATMIPENVERFTTEGERQVYNKNGKKWGGKK